jgi:hypothetical protein
VEDNVGPRGAGTAVDAEQQQWQQQRQRQWQQQIVRIGL